MVRRSYVTPLFNGDSILGVARRKFPSSSCILTFFLELVESNHTLALFSFPAQLWGWVDLSFGNFLQVKIVLSPKKTFLTSSPHVKSGCRFLDTKTHLIMPLCNLDFYTGVQSCGNRKGPYPNCSLTKTCLGKRKNNNERTTQVFAMSSILRKHRSHFL